MLGIEAVGIQTPPLRPRVVEIDPRTVSNTATLGGAGAFLRFRPTDIVGLDLTLRSGSLRYVDTRDDHRNVISQDLFVADVGTVLYLARGEMGSVGIDAGVGGVLNRVGYAIDDLDRSVQRFGSFVTRIGFDVELVTRRVAFVFTLRSLGVITPQNDASHDGPVFDSATREETKPAVPRFQTYVAAGAGVAYRF
ncbi:MAG: hypothetical protein B7733_00880 [Myxococcales bacterium FL481]|nr:MAG: hypothetical protein B7733_00880 [Myxococcales bacterium FL481]